MRVVYSALIDYPFHMRKAAVTILLAMMLASCTVTESITLDSQSGLESVSDIKAEEFFVSVLEDFAEFLPENGKSIMDSSVESFAGQLSEKDGVTAASYEKTGENTYLLSFSASDIDTVLSSFGAAEQSLINRDEKSFSFYLDIANYPELKTIVPFLADPNFEVYGPEYNQGMSEADYLDMIYFLLGEEGPDAISNGNVTINLTVPGTVTETVNAEKVSDNTISYSFPVISFLLLSEPLSFSVQWE